MVERSDTTGSVHPFSSASRSDSGQEDLLVPDEFAEAGGFVQGDAEAIGVVGGGVDDGGGQFDLGAAVFVVPGVGGAVAVWLEFDLLVSIGVGVDKGDSHQI